MTNMSARAWLVAALSVVGAIASGIALALAWLLWGNPGPPITWRAWEVQTPVVRPGEPVQMIGVLDRDRECIAIVIGVMLDERGEAVLRFPVMTGGYGDVGKGVRTPVSRTAPQVPGRYRYRATILHMCERGQYTSRLPDAAFEVVP